jgi:hypothetical protein
MLADEASLDGLAGAVGQLCWAGLLEGSRECRRVLLLIAVAQEHEPLSSAAVARMRLLIMHHRAGVKKPLVSVWTVAVTTGW